VHLREDRRHIQDEGVRRLREPCIKLNLEMAATDEMVGIACALSPDRCSFPKAARRSRPRRSRRGA
jgi:pyridoxine 5'-phosphate synthase PdxJ